MSTPNPLIPQGTFQAQAAKGASNVRLAVATIVAIHVVFFGGLLLQGCKRDTTTAENTAAETNAEPSTNLALPALDSSSLYYTNASTLPSDTGAVAGTVSTPPSNGFGTTTPPATPDALWQATNLSTQLGGASQTSGTQPSGATKEYTVVSGDSFSRIASRNRTTVSAIRAANPDVDPMRIKPGDKLKIPEAAARDGGSIVNDGMTAPSAAANTYTVKAGDTLTKIARAHGITISQLRAANNMRTSRVNAGQKLKIPAPAPSNGTTANVTNPGL